MLILFNIIKVIRQDVRQVVRPSAWSSDGQVVLPYYAIACPRARQTTGRQTGRSAGKKLEIPNELLEMTTPPSILKPFSFSPRQPEIPPLPKNSVYLTKKKIWLKLGRNTQNQGAEDLLDGWPKW